MAYGDCAVSDSSAKNEKIAAFASFEGNTVRIFYILQHFCHKVPLPHFKNAVLFFFRLLWFFFQMQVL
ncbi:hypothetical protein D0T87_14125 [Bacteroides sp. 51]|nr:hypothetical protein [Bacteroides sp. 51]